MAPKSKSMGTGSSGNSSTSTSTLTVKSRPPKNYITRPSNDNVKNLSKIYFHPETLKMLDINVGDLIKINKFETISSPALGLVAVDNDCSVKNVMEINEELRKLIGLNLGDRIMFEKYTKTLKYAKEVVVHCNDTVDEKKAGKILQEIGILCPGLKIVVDDNNLTIKNLNDKEIPLEDLSIAGTEFSDVDGLISPYFIFDRSKCTIKFINNDYSLTKYPQLQELKGFEEIGGLQDELSSIKNFLKIPLENPKIYSKFNIKPLKNLIIYGPSGCGKSLILEKLKIEFFEKIHFLKINTSMIFSKYLGDGELKLKEIFNEAKSFEPSIILIDEIDKMFSNNQDNDDNNDQRILSSFITLLDDLNYYNHKILIVGATNQLNNLNIALRRPGRFDKEIEIGIPNLSQRFEILQKFFIKMKNYKIDDLMGIASLTHGYNGSDLMVLIKESIMLTIERNGEFLEMKDILKAIKNIRPSSMKEIYLEMPKVKWEDIGGQEELKLKLKEMVQLPLENQEQFKKIGINSPKGVLLYGPPGCSKTLTAKALATESGLNFLAIKGPEILNKYVGESEKSIREIFRKARAASPSIIFFDEIDAISQERDGSNGNNNVLITLLNEIDGVEELNGVIIVGATNKPFEIDSALMRPGRLDRHIYVGPPDLEGIQKILQMKTKKFDIDEDYLMKNLSPRLVGCSGAEVVLICQEAGISAIMENKENCERVDKKHFEKVMENFKKGITTEMLEYYEEFAKS